MKINIGDWQAPISYLSFPGGMVANFEQDMPPIYRKLAGDIKVAFDQTLEIVKQTKPSWAMSPAK